MKRSQYLYHMQVYHGVSNLTKAVYDRPGAVRIWEGSSQSVEVLCRYCDSWVSLSHGPVRALSSNAILSMHATVIRGILVRKTKVHA